MPYRKKTEEEKQADEQEIIFHCVICSAVIDAARARKRAVTCCPAHAKQFKNAKRRKRDAEKCRMCNRPSSAAERADFTLWRKERGARRGRPNVIKPAALPSAADLDAHEHDRQLAEATA